MSQCFSFDRVVLLLAAGKLAEGQDSNQSATWFEVVDLHSPRGDFSGDLSVLIDGASYSGRIDVGIVPYGVAGSSCIPNLRLGIKLKCTADQKARYTLRHEATGGECMWTTISCPLIPY